MQQFPPSVRSPSVYEERIKPGHWLWFVRSILYTTGLWHWWLDGRLNWVFRKRVYRINWADQMQFPFPKPYWQQTADSENNAVTFKWNKPSQRSTGWRVPTPPSVCPVSHAHGITSRFWLARRRPCLLAPQAAAQPGSAPVVRPRPPS